MRVRLLFAVASAAAVGMAVPGAAQAVTCGSEDPETGQVARAALTLDESSRPAAAFKDGTGIRPMSLIYRATGCTFSGAEEEPQLEILPTDKDGEGDTGDLPADSVSIESATFESSEMALSLQVDSAKFDPGTYGELAQVKAPYLVTTRTPITVTRSESNMAIPLGIGMFAGLVALLLWYMGTKAATGLRATRLQLLVTVLAGVGAGGIAALTSYWDQSVWTFSANAPATAGAAFTGATTGTMAVLLRALAKSPDPAPALAPEPAPATAPPG